MYVGVCNSVTEKQIFDAAKKGAKTVKHLKETLGVASECTSCVGCAKACLKQAHHAHGNAHQHHQSISLEAVRMACAA